MIMGTITVVVDTGIISMATGIIIAIAHTNTKGFQLYLRLTAYHRHHDVPELVAMQSLEHVQLLAIEFH